MSYQTPEPRNGVNVSWVICLAEETQRNKLRDSLINLRLQRQHQYGVYFHSRKEDLFNKMQKGNFFNRGLENLWGEGKQTISSILNPSNYNSQSFDYRSIHNSKKFPSTGSVRNFLFLEMKYKKTKKKNNSFFDDTPVNNPHRGNNDGYWIVLQDWTSCTLRCGGGLSYLHLMCVPPRGGGAPCPGQAIRTRPCNTQPCPTTKTLNIFGTQKSENNNYIQRPVVKMMALSNNPLRYDKCHMKESDALMIEDVQETKNLSFGQSDSSIRSFLPVRVVMNNKSVTINMGNDISGQMYTFLLANSVISKLKNKPNCFLIKSAHQEKAFCSINTLSKEFVEEWLYDFNLFKNQCSQPREVVPIPKNQGYQSLFSKFNIRHRR
jgi:hypothetical protein